MKHKQKNDLLDTLKRVQADYENYKKRVDRDKESFTKYATTHLITSLLPLLDNFERALANTSNQKEFVKGIELIYAQLHTILKQEGVTLIDASTTFNPHEHEALLQEVSDKPQGTILEELQKGYKLHDHIIRHTKVKISGEKQNE
jgi:molecular chaperone GrpE